MPSRFIAKGRIHMPAGSGNSTYAPEIPQTQSRFIAKGIIPLPADHGASTHSPTSYPDPQTLLPQSLVDELDIEQGSELASRSITLALAGSDNSTRSARSQARSGLIVKGIMPVPAESGKLVNAAPMPQTRSRFIAKGIIPMPADIEASTHTSSLACPNPSILLPQSLFIELDVEQASELAYAYSRWNEERSHIEALITKLDARLATDSVPPGPPPSRTSSGDVLIDPDVLQTRSEFIAKGIIPMSGPSAPPPGLAGYAGVDTIPQMLRIRSGFIAKGIMPIPAPTSAPPSSPAAFADGFTAPQVPKRRSESIAKGIIPLPIDSGAGTRSTSLCPDTLTLLPRDLLPELDVEASSGLANAYSRQIVNESSSIQDLTGRLNFGLADNSVISAPSALPSSPAFSVTSSLESDDMSISTGPSPVPRAS